MNESPFWILASQNKNKLRELQDLLSSEVDVRLSPTSLEVEETGATFHENALLKAEAFSKAFNATTLSDDSGLVIPALDGQPGVYSARWAGPSGDYQRVFQRLEKDLAHAPQPLAYFVCVLCLFIPSKPPLFFEGRLKGTLTFPPRGDKGFGYDPIFVPEGFSKTCAELTSAEKNKISHRAQALKQLKDHLKFIQTP